MIIKNYTTTDEIEGFGSNQIAYVFQTGYSVQCYRAGHIAEGAYNRFVPITEEELKEWLTEFTNVEIQEFEPPKVIEPLFSGDAPTYSKEEYDTEFKAWQHEQQLPTQLLPWKWYNSNQPSSEHLQEISDWRSIWVSHRENGTITLKCQGVFFAGGSTIELIPNYFPDELREQMMIPVSKYGRCAPLTIEQAKKAWSLLCNRYAKKQPAQSAV